MSTTEQRQRQHTVRFQTAEEGSLAAMMAASAGVSTSEWVATAARHRMLDWLKGGYCLSEALVTRHAEKLVSELGKATELDDIPEWKTKVSTATSR